VDGFLKTANKLGRSLTGIFKRKDKSADLGSADFTADDLLMFSKVGRRVAS
jgi:hypothetical protein